MNNVNLNVDTRKNSLPRILRNLSSNLVLESIIGTTSNSNFGFSFSPSGDEIAYLAGCVAIIYNLKYNIQTSFLFSQNNTPSKCKCLKALAYSPNGNYLAVSESGYSPLILIWNLSSNTVISRLKLHIHEVIALVWTSNSKYLVSIGSEYDKKLAVWDIGTQSVILSSEIDFRINSIATSPCGTFFVTVGLNNIKFWYFDDPNRPTTIKNEHSISTNNCEIEYIHVTFGTGPEFEGYCYSISSNGGIFMISNLSKNVEKMISLNTTVNSISFSRRGLAVACINGTVRIFDPKSLVYLYSLPKPNIFGEQMNSIVSPGKMQATDTFEDIQETNYSSVYPDTKTVMWSPNENYLVCFYSDRSIFIWSISVSNKIGRFRFFLGHGDSIWDIDTLSRNNFKYFPQDSIATCSSDGTIKFWNFSLELKNEGIFRNNVESETMNSNENFIRSTSFCNVYSCEIIPCIYVYKNEEFKKSIIDDNSLNNPIDPSLTSKLSSKIRAVKFFSNGPYIAAGDNNGNIHVYNFSNNKFEKIAYIEAHESEILSLDFAKISEECSILVSASRDRLIHVFNNDRKRNDQKISSGKCKSSFCTNFYKLVNTIDDHTAAVTSVLFTADQQYLVSAGADRTLMVHKISNSGIACKRVFSNTTNYSIYDLALQPINSHIIAVGKDKKIRFFDLYSGKLVRVMDSYSDTDLLKVAVDSSGLLMATCAKDKSIRLYHIYSGEILAVVSGHSQLVTGIKFLNDCKKLVSISGDGCIFVWNLPKNLTKYILLRIKDQKKSHQEVQNTKESNFLDLLVNPIYLPEWVLRKKASFSLTPNNTSSESINDEPKTSIEESFVFSPGDLGGPLFKVVESDNFNNENISTVEYNELILNEDKIVVPINNSQIVYYDQVKECVTPETTDSSGSQFKDLIWNCEYTNHDYIEVKNTINKDFDSDKIFNEEILNSTCESIESDFIPTNSILKGRRSLSIEFFLKNPVLDMNEKFVAKEKKILIPADVEKTRARLEELGISYGVNRKCNSSDLTQKSTHFNSEVTSNIENDSSEIICEMDSENSKFTSKESNELYLNSEKKNLSESEINEKNTEPFEDIEVIDDLINIEDSNSGGNPLFLDTLADAFDRTIEFYYELKQNDEDNLIARQIATVFSDMQQKIDTILVNDRNKLLEKYSDILVDLVKAKLDGN